MIKFQEPLRIVIDLQGFQRGGNRIRGIGRYSLEIVKSLIHNYSHHEYVLLANSSLFDFSNYFCEELNDNKLNVIYYEWAPVGRINEDVVHNYSKNSIAIQLRSYALTLIHADLILLTSFFDGFKDNTLIDCDESYNLPPIVSIIYDLIPLVRSSEYLDIDEEYRDFYLEKIKKLNKIDALLTISESSKKEILKFTEFKSNQVYNVSAACDNNLFNNQKVLINDSQININNFGRYLLYTGAIDPRKNLYRLLKAYSLLPLHISTKYKLVLTGPYSKTEIKLIHSWLDELNLSTHNIIILGYVNDQDLVILYQNCYLFVFPSLHEGFGLPVLEAISCGAPVIASFSSSIPEILQFDSCLFDPFNIIQIKDLICKACTDVEFYNELKRNSEDRSNIFSWDITSSNTIEAIYSILDNTLINVRKNKSISNLHDMNKFNYNKLVLLSLIHISEPTRPY